MTSPPAPPPFAALLADGPASLFLDFDGTLVDLAPHPDAIRPAPRLAERLAALADRLEGRLAVVSGRALRDVERHLGSLPFAAAGSHGSDVRGAGGQRLGQGPQPLPAALAEALAEHAAAQGLDYEEKPHGGALHYRARPDRGADVLAFARALADAHGWAVQEGKCVVELVAPGPGKGGAVHALMREAAFAGSRPLFIGDDLTDEAGFAAAEELGGLGILVGERVPSAARFRLADVAAVHAWLAL